MHHLAKPFALVLLLAPLGAQTFVRVRDDIVAPRHATAPTSTSLTSVTGASCGTVVGVSDGMPIVNAPGAYVTTNAFMNPACINRRGELAFVGDATGSRNQGIFVADSAGVHAIAMGCGGGGGSGQHGSCGDPSPIGGSFAGFFGGTVFTPAINDNGDVLFLADLFNASSPRGLFLYLASAQSFVKICAIGDPSPLGGTVTAIGPGNLNRDLDVVFLAQSSGGQQYVCDLLQWNAGALSVFSATGYPAPGGATVSMLGTESFGFVDGTTVFAGPVPSINDCGQVAFRIITNGGAVGRGIAVRQNGVDSWYLTDAMQSPNGGSYFDFQGAAINGSGQIAVFSDYMLNGNATSGWFVGKPGNWRHALSFYDSVDGGQVYGLAFSRLPMNFLTDDGDVVVWCDLNSNGNMGRVVLCTSDGSKVVLARQGSPTGVGGSFGYIDAWPSLNSAGRVSISSGTPGATFTSAHLVGVLCGPGVASSPCTSLNDNIRVDDFGPAGGSFLLFASFHAQNVPLPPYGALMIGPSMVMLQGPTPYPGLSGPRTLSLPVPNMPVLVGLSLHFQSLGITPSTLLLSNRATTALR